GPLPALRIRNEVGPVVVPQVEIGPHGEPAVTTYRIPFNKPSLTGAELNYVADAVLRGHTAGDGIYTKRCQEFLERSLGASRALLTTSCTHALEMAALLLNCGPGDEGVVRAFRFV